MQKHWRFLISFLMVIFLSRVFLNKISAKPQLQDHKVKLGIDVLLEKQLDLVKGKRVGLITNPTGMTSDLRSTIDALNDNSDVKLEALFGPEHGVRCDVSGGETVTTFKDKKTGITVYSLYGETQRPTPDMLKDIDVLLFDIQEVGWRPYTYLYTMAYGMEAARDAGIKFIVLDRPNPLGGEKLGGNVLDPKFSSFIGLYPIPAVYGMTMGELAQFFNKEFGINCDLSVVPMEGWQRKMLWNDTGLMWVNPSPHVPHAETAFYLATTGCIGELGTVSVGVGYTSPFEQVGAPWMDGSVLADELNSKNIPGVFFRPVFFRPYYYLFVKQQCSGVQIHILNFEKFDPVAAQIHILAAIQKLYPVQKIFDTRRSSSFDRAFGTDEIRNRIVAGESAEKIIAGWEKQLADFNILRVKYLLY